MHLFGKKETKEKKKKSLIAYSEQPRRNDASEGVKPEREMGKAIFEFLEKPKNCQIANSAGETTEIG